MLALFLLGAGLAVLGVSVSRQALFSPSRGLMVLAASAGALLALLPGPGLSARQALGRGARTYAFACGLVSACGLVVQFATDGAWMRAEATHLLLGIGTGGCWRMALPLLQAMVPARRSESLMGLGLASFALGGVTASAIHAALASRAAAGALPLLATAVPVTLCFLAVRVGGLRIEKPGGLEKVGPARAAAPPAALMAASLLFQTAAWATVTCWLAVHLTRGAAVSGASGAAVSAACWLALGSGWYLSRRILAIRSMSAMLLLPFAVAAAGVPLLLTGAWAVTSLGTILLGLGIGALFPLSLEALADWPTALAGSRWLRIALRVALPAGLLAGWPVAEVALGAGSDAVLWAVLGSLALATLSLALLALEYRLTGDGPASA